MSEINIKEDIINLSDMRKNLKRFVDEVGTEHNQKVIIRNGKTTAILMSIDEYQEIQDYILALELQLGLFQALEEQKRGELIELDELAARLGIDMNQFDFSQKPEGYEQMIPVRYGDDHQRQ